MAKLEGSIEVNLTAGARFIAEAIDRARRDTIQRRNAAKGEVTEAYYEGMRVGLAEMQAFAEKVAAI